MIMPDADTITDAQIKRLQRHGLHRAQDAAVACKYALLGDYCARARCAEILNNRRKGTTR